jgi:hypothetical protein
MTASKYVNSVLTAALDMGFEHKWYYTSEQVERGNAARNELKIAPNAEIRITRTVRFILGIENSIGLDNTRIAGTWQKENGQGINLFRPEDTQYYLMTFISL